MYVLPEDLSNCHVIRANFDFSPASVFASVILNAIQYFSEALLESFMKGDHFENQVWQKKVLCVVVHSLCTLRLFRRCVCFLIHKNI